MSTEPERSNWKLSRPILGTAENREYGYRMGHVLTPYGVVGLYDQIAQRGHEAITRLDMVVGGRLHTATWQRKFTDRYLKTLASRFALSLVRTNPND